MNNENIQALHAYTHYQIEMRCSNPQLQRKETNGKKGATPWKIRKKNKKEKKKTWQRVISRPTDRTLSFITRMMNCTYLRSIRKWCDMWQNRKCVSVCVCVGRCRVTWSVCDAFEIQRQQPTNDSFQFLFRQLFWRLVCVCVINHIIYSYFYCELWICIFNLII